MDGPLQREARQPPVNAPTGRRHFAVGPLHCALTRPQKTRAQGFASPVPQQNVKQENTKVSSLLEANAFTLGREKQELSTLQVLGTFYFALTDLAETPGRRGRL